MIRTKALIKDYLSMVLLCLPGILFAALLFVFQHHPNLHVKSSFPYFPVHFWIICLFGLMATLGGFLDWQYHRNTLDMKISQKERDAEAAALGIGGLPMFILMFLAMLAENPKVYLIPILLVLIYTLVAISYDEFVFHRKRCGKLETIYHRMLVFGNGIAWLVWIHFIFV